MLQSDLEFYSALGFWISLSIMFISFFISIQRGARIKDIPLNILLSVMFPGLLIFGLSLGGELDIVPDKPYSYFYLGGLLLLAFSLTGCVYTGMIKL